MYRGAVSITEHQPADVLEPLRGTGLRVYPDPTKALRSGRFACPALRAIVGLGVFETAPRFCYTDFSWRDGGIPATVDFFRIRFTAPDF